MKVEWTICKHSTKSPVVHSGGWHLHQQQISLSDVDFLPDPALVRGKGSWRPPSHCDPHHMTNALLCCLPLLYHSLTHLSYIPKLGITISYHANQCSAVREITEKFTFTVGYQKETAFTTTPLLFYVCFHILFFVSFLCNLLSRREAYKFPVHALSIFALKRSDQHAVSGGSAELTQERQNQHCNL